MREKKYLWIIVTLPILAILILTIPPVYVKIFSYAYTVQRVFSIAEFCILCTFLIASMALLVLEYFDISLSWYKKKFSYLMFALFLNSIQFLLFAGLDPVHMFQDFSRIRLLPMQRYYTAANFTNLLISASIGVVGIILAAIQSIQYFYVDYDRDRIELSIKKEVRNAGIISTGLVHGIKNDLLSSKFLSAKIQQLSSRESPGPEDIVLIRENAKKINDISREMLNRLDFMYRNFKEIKTVLLPISSAELVDSLKEKLSKVQDLPPISYTVTDCIILADREVLSEAVYNIALNSVEATRSIPEPKISIELFLTRALTTIKIIDNGPGIPKGIQKEIFMPYTSTKNTQTNWGLGLCYSRQIVKKHMGDIRFESSSQKGTVFFITLPKFKA